MNKRNFTRGRPSFESAPDMVEKTTTIAFRAYAALTWTRATVLQAVLKGGLQALGWVITDISEPSVMSEDVTTGTLSVTFLVPSDSEESAAAQLDEDLIAVLGLYNFQLIHRSPFQTPFPLA